MGWLEWALWGAFGGCAMEALDFIVAVRRWRRWPWDMGSASLVAEQGQPTPAGALSPGRTLPAPGVGAYLVAGVLRVGLGAGIAAAVGASAPDTGSPWLLLVVGAAAPLLLEKLTMLVPLLQAAPAVPAAAGPSLPAPQSSAAEGPPPETAASAPASPPPADSSVVEPAPGVPDRAADRQHRSG
ncbi:hypothetical protein ACHZ98_29340 [Streptomyces sp. MAR4 CNY-716]